MAEASHSTQPDGLAGRLLRIASMNLPERPMRWAQSRLRDGRLGWLFVGPNLIVFGLFTFLPIVIDVCYALTGGTELLPGERPLSGARTSPSSLACQNYLRSRRAAERDLFWYGVWNTLQVRRAPGRAHDRVQPDHRAGAEPQDHRSRLLPRRVLLSGAALAGRRRADLEMDPAARGRAQRRRCRRPGCHADRTGCSTRTGRSSGRSSSASGRIWDSTRSILLAGLQAIPRDVYEAAAMDAAPPVAHLPAHHPAAAHAEPRSWSFVLALIRAVQIFDEVYVLTGGGPGTATTFSCSSSTRPASRSRCGEYGLAAAASLLLAGVLLRADAGCSSA